MNDAEKYEGLSADELAECRDEERIDELINIINIITLEIKNYVLWSTMEPEDLYNEYTMFRDHIFEIVDYEHPNIE